jgi:hypothetical protein
VAAEVKAHPEQKSMWTLDKKQIDTILTDLQDFMVDALAPAEAYQACEPFRLTLAECLLNSGKLDQRVLGMTLLCDAIERTRGIADKKPTAHKWIDETKMAKWLADHKVRPRRPCTSSLCEQSRAEPALMYRCSYGVPCVCACVCVQTLNMILGAHEELFSRGGDVLSFCASANALGSSHLELLWKRRLTHNAFERSLVDSVVLQLANTLPIKLVRGEERRCLRAHINPRL